MTATKTAEPVVETFTLDLAKLKWHRPLHIHETPSAITITPWKALCGAILYDVIHDSTGHKTCQKCLELAGWKP